MLDEAVAQAQLSPDQTYDIRQAEMLVRGRRDDVEVILVVEASATVALDDVAHARRRAELLGLAGVTTLPVVAGRLITDEAETAAVRDGVWRVIDGSTAGPAA